MIDLEKLRERVQGQPTDQGVYGPTWLNPLEALALLDHIAALEKDAGRLDWIEKNGDVRIQRVRAGFNGPIRWDVEYGPYDGEARSKKDMRTAIDTAMESNHG